VKQTKLKTLFSSSAQGELSILTKGDNNQVDDRGLYNFDEKQMFISREELLGIAVGYLPKAGVVTIWMNDYPWFKYALISSMAFLVMIGRE
jgi:signal peptidase I